MKRLAILALWLCVAAAAAPAHELAANRATLVLRDQRHLSLTLYVDYAHVLHRALAPDLAFADFLAVHAAMPAAEFAADLQRAEAQLAGATILTGADGSALHLRDWQWPASEPLQADFQQRAMQLIVAPDEHRHAEPSEIHAEATAAVDLIDVTLTLPAAFERVLIVWYQPKQTWSTPDSAVNLRFAPAPGSPPDQALTSGALHAPR